MEPVDVLLGHIGTLEYEIKEQMKSIEIHQKCITDAWERIDQARVYICRLKHAIEKLNK